MPARLVFYFLTLVPHDYVIYCQARGLSGHTSPCGECVCFFWKTPCILKPKKFISFSRVRTLSGHTWSAAKKFSILDLSSLHPYGKPYLGYVAQLWFALLGNDARCSATAHNCSATHYGGRTMSWTTRLWFALARTSSRRRCITSTRHSRTSYGGYDPGYPWQTTWAMPLGAARPTRRSLAGHGSARRPLQGTERIS